MFDILLAGITIDARLFRSSLSLCQFEWISLIGVSHLGAFGNLYIELQALISSQRVRKGFSLWKSSTSQEVTGADRPLESCKTMAGSIPCIIIKGSFLSGRRSKGGSTSEVSECAIVW
jgi:hypothetical protein